MKHRLMSLVAIACVLASGCASTSLTLHLDLYKEDPFALVPLRPAKVLALLRGLDLAEEETEALAQARVDLADRLFATYESVQKVLVLASEKNYDSHQLDTLREYLAEYKRVVKDRADGVKSLVDQARASLTAYLDLTQQGKSTTLSAQLEVARRVEDVNRALTTFGGPLGTDFEGSLTANWSVVARSMGPVNVDRFLQDVQNQGTVQELRESIRELAKLVDDLKRRGYRISRKADRYLSEAVMPSEDKPGALKKSIDAVAKAAVAIPVSLALGDRGMAALSDLTVSTTLIFSQIDRLQDPADPVWRIVSAPENETKWNTTFSETYFYSEGNNSVVVVRDTPMSFRVQRGANNPGALVQGQLQISRAVANAAITIAGAATGASLPKLPAAGQETKEGEPGRSPDLEQVAMRKAKAERQASLHAQELRTFRRTLSSFRDEVQRVSPSDAAQLASIRARLQAVLRGYEAVFSPSE